MFLLVFVFILIKFTDANIGCPTFNWVPTSKSEDGVPLLNIRFPDNREDDFAVLKKIPSGSESVCLLEGHLMLEQNVSVKITKKCNVENDFQIELNSKRLLYSYFNVTNGISNPFLPKENSTSIPGGQNPQNQSLPNDFLVLKIVASYDLSFKSKFGKLSKALTEAIIEEAQKLFSLPSLTVDIKLHLIEIKEINQTFSDPQLLEVLYGNASEDDRKMPNALLLFTGNSINSNLIKPNNGSICSTNPKERSAIVPWRTSSDETAKDLAKELGYLLGMKDDFELNHDLTKILTRSDRKGQTCTNMNGIMDYSSEHIIWSTCSVEDFLDYYNTVKSKQGHFCLNENPTQRTAYSKVLVAGGDGEGYKNYLDDVEIIDLISSKTICEKPQNLPFRISKFVGGLGFQEKPLITIRLDDKLKACHSYENGSWKLSQPLKEERTGFAMTKSPFKDGSKLFLSGGHSKFYTNSSEVLTEKGWQLSVPMPIQRAFHCMVTINSTSVMVIGGLLYDTYIKESYIFNAESNTWTEGPALSIARIDHSCGSIRKNSHTHEKSLIVAGGQFSKNPPLTYSVEVLDPDSESWRNGPSLPFIMFGAAMVEDPSGGVVLVGGYSTLFGVLDKIYRLPHAGSDATWELLPQKLKKARLQHAAFLVPDEIANCK